MTIDTVELRKAIDYIKPGISTKALFAQADCIIFSGGYVRSFNDRTASSHPLDIGVEGAIQASDMIAFLKRVKSDAVTITVTDGVLYMKSGRMRVSFVLQDIKAAFLSQETYDFTVTECTELFRTLSDVAVCASTDYVNAVLTCVHIKEGYVQASDATVAAKERVGELPIAEALISADTVKSLKNYSLSGVALDGAWLHTKDDQGYISLRLQDGVFVNTSQIFSDNNSIELKIDDDFLSLLDRASVFSTTRVLFSIKNGICTATAKESNKSFKESCDISCTKDIEFGINPLKLTYLKGKSFDRVYLVPDRFLLFKSDNWSFVCALVK